MSKKRILIVDDEKSLTTWLKSDLEGTGNYEVRVEYWAEDVLPAAREFKPDLVLMETFTSDVASQFSADPELKNTPIVLFSPAFLPHIVEENDGIICELPCLAKPVTLEKVIETIEKYARKPA